MNKHTPLMSAHNHYSLRKMSIGLVSVLLGTSLYLGVSQNDAQAATSSAANAAETSAVKADSVAKAKTPISSALDQQAASANEAISQAKADRASTTGSTSSLTSKKADQPDLAAAKPAPAPKSEGKGTTAGNKADADKLANLSLKGSKSAQLSEKEAAASAKEEKGLKPKLLKAKADPTENGLKLRQQTPDGKASLAWTYTDSTGAEHTGHNMLGYYENGRPINLSFFINDQPGTKWSLTIPANLPTNVNREKVYGYEISYQTPDPEQSSFSHTDATLNNPYETFSGKINSNKTIRIQFTLTPLTNSVAFDSHKTPIDTGDVQRKVQWSINGVQQTPLDFINHIEPAFLHPFTGRSKVNSKYDPNDPYPIYNDSNKDEIVPGTDYQYILDLNETPGITDADKFPTGKVNQVVNNGTTITIPVPEGFELDHDLTMSRNGFNSGDQTTITQNGGAGHDIVITVPANSGIQHWNDNGGSIPYYIIGKYDVAIPLGTKILKAAPGSQITIVQHLKGSGDLTAKLDPWIEKTSGTARPVIEGKTLVNIAGAESDLNLPSGAVQNKILTYFGFKNQSGLPLSPDKNKLQITLKMGDGLAVKQIKTPKSNTLLPGTTSYTYSVYYWKDPTPGTGTVSAGDSVSAPTGKLIRSIVLTPNYWTPLGGTSDAIPNASIFSQNTDNIVDFKAIGDLADKHQKTGQPVKAGDEIESSITVDITTQGQTKPTENGTNVIQKVISAANIPSQLNAIQEQGNKAAGAEKAGNIALITTSGSRNQYIKSPIFYYVLPQNARVAKNEDGSWDIDSFNHDGNEEVTIKPKITVLNVGDRQIVKFDYSNTNYNFDASMATNNRVYLDNLTNAVNGTDYGYVYIVSPTTKIDNTHNPIIDTSKTGSAAYPSDYPSKYPDIFQDAPKDFNPAWVENTSKNVYLVGNFPWEIDQAVAANTPQTSAGNTDGEITQNSKSKSGISDDKGSKTMEYAISIVNNNSKSVTNVKQIINLPNASDSNNSFTFNLTKPISLIGEKTIPNQIKIKYSDVPAALTTEQGPGPDISGYKNWDDFSDKSKIRSAVIIIQSIPANSMIGKFLLTGEDPTIAQDAGKTGTLSSGAYIDSLIPFVIDRSNHYDEAASITIQGSTTPPAKQDQKAELRFYDDDANSFITAASDQTDTGKTGDSINFTNGNQQTQALLDNGYEFVGITKGSDPDSTDFLTKSKYQDANFGTFDDVDDPANEAPSQVFIVHFKRQTTPPAKQDQKAELRFYDDDTHSFITAAPDQTATGKTGDPISFANGNKQTQDLVKAGYEFVGITKGPDPESTDFLTKSKYQDANFGTFDDIDDPADAAPSQVFIVHFKKNKPNKPGENPDGGGNKPGQNPGGKPGNKPGNKPSGKPSNKPGNKPSNNPSSKPDNKPGEKPSRQPSQPASTPNKTSKPQQVIKHDQQPVGSIAKTSKAKAIRQAEAPQAIPSKNKLPQTGNKTQPLALLGLGLLTLAAIIGLAADRKH